MFVVLTKQNSFSSTLLSINLWYFQEENENSRYSLCCHQHYILINVQWNGAVGEFFIQSQGRNSMNYIDTINIISHNSQLEIIQNSPLAPHLSWLLPLYCSVKTVHFFAMQMLDYVKSGCLPEIETQPSRADQRTSY